MLVTLTHGPAEGQTVEVPDGTTEFAVGVPDHFHPAETKWHRYGVTAPGRAAYSRKSYRAERVVPKGLLIVEPT